MRKHPFVALGLSFAVGACTPPSMPLSLSSSKAPPVPAPQAASGIACERGDVVEVLGKHFCAVPEALTWAGAAERCAGFGGQLAQIGSRVEEAALRAAVASPLPAQTLWLDLRRGDNGFGWGDRGTALQAGRWMAGEPNDAGGAEDCGEWSTSSGRYNDVSCGAHRAVLCEMTPASSCSAELVKTPHGRYCAYSRALLSHGEARVLCERTGSTLAKLESDAENDAFRATLGSLIGADRVWVGMSDAEQEGTWKWSAGVPVTHGWLQNEPNDAGGAEDCGEWWPQTGGFNDMPCQAKLPALCEL